ncbi:tripartite tricarboxylate transporter substrate binding protein [Mangrovicoccus sp. HB161399]|uniref:Bug family tripartite tricarboxylate transporter substrate binding protein n=1 Tax=Mangrovicoccus sp. HB161399 TaxID=2720392 RepID=UPI001C12FA2D|nr:tripartite tricarboxylate transporter substrate binding protein [Mangrovicoccus sp. HB161399]
MKMRLALGGGFAVLAAASVLSLGVPQARAEFPEKPVEMTVLFGGTASTIAQVLSETMAGELGEPVVPVSRTGGGGAVGYSHVMATAPDGYSIVWNSNSVNTTAHVGHVPYSYEDFVPIARVSEETPALAVNAARGWTSLQDMAREVSASDDHLKVGISGKGSFTHLVSAALFDAMGIGDQVTFIAYGDGKAPVELLAGRIDAAIQWPGQFKSYVDTGDLSVLAVTGSERIDFLPGVPTAQEQGVDIDITMWRGLAAPKDTPPEVVEKLAAAAEAATNSEAFRKAAATMGFQPAYAGPQDFAALIARDDAFYAGLLKKLGLGQ